MIWFTWRQFRTPAWITIGALAVFAAVLAVTGHNLANQWSTSGAVTCHAHCGSAISAFLDDVKNSTSEKMYTAGVAIMYVVPALIGIFWGAPLIARELETGTHRLAWNQSITRTRWLATKLAVIGGAVSMPYWIRGHLAPAVHATTPLNLSKIENMLIGPHNVMKVVSGVHPAGAWVLTNTSITSAGHVFTGPANPKYCGMNQGADVCVNWIGSLGLRQDIVYQPASHFWALQWTETGIFAAAAVLLAGFCFWWTRRRLT